MDIELIGDNTVIGSEPTMKITIQVIMHTLNSTNMRLFWPEESKTFLELENNDVIGSFYTWHVTDIPTIQILYVLDID